VLQQHGDAEFVADRLARIRAEGTGAQRQERAYAQQGLPGLSALYRTSTDAPASHRSATAPA
jgi:carboxylate-amine ligase